MKTRILFTALLLCLLGFFSNNLTAQEAPQVDHSYKPLSLNLNEDGSRYVRFIIWHQHWLTTSNLYMRISGTKHKCKKARLGCNRIYWVIH